MTNQIANRERRKSAIGVKVGPEHRPGGADARVSQHRLKPRRRQVNDSNRITDQRQRRTHALERFRPLRDREMAGLPARGGAQLRKVDR